MPARAITLTLKVTVQKNDGKPCQPDEIADEIITEQLDGQTLYVQGADNDEQSEYEITTATNITE